MDEMIKSLDDATATRLLLTITKAHQQTDKPDSTLPAELLLAISRELEVNTADEKVTDGEIARQALQLLATDPAKRENITALITGPATKQLTVEPVTAIALTAGLVFVLKTRGYIRKNDDGCWVMGVGWEALDKELLKGFVQKLLTWIPDGPFSGRIE